MELLPEKIAELVHELRVLPFDNMGFNGVVGPWSLTNYTVWLMIAAIAMVIVFVVAARRVKLESSTGLTGMIELGVEFINNMATEVIGEKDGKKYVPLLATIFFMILISNMFGLIPGAKSFAGSMGGTVAMALIVWVVFVWVGFSKNGFIGYFKSLIPAGVREMPLAGRLLLGGFIFLLEFISYFIVRPLTQSVRLFANMYAGHVILGVFSAFVALFIPIFMLDKLQFSLTGGIVGLIALVFLILMYAFEVFVAFIQAYVFTILTAVYIQSSVHASDH
ncbi:MAG: F0F1 ATP synthase subunit A [Coriobacteriia bacterium]|nr:F0F1 ATP synthase subunit A [Coriobacteriia bacterium]